MNHLIEILPALKRIRLMRVGCWDALDMEFLPGLNIITDDSHGSGKSTIFRAIIQAIHPTGLKSFPLSPTNGHSDGEIHLELASSSVEQCIPVFANTGSESVGHDRMKFLLLRLQSAQTGQVVLIESDGFEALSDEAFSEVAKNLNAPSCQVICIMSRRLKPEQFKHARIFACFWDEKTNRAGVRLVQNGGSNVPS